MSEKTPWLATLRMDLKDMDKYYDRLAAECKALEKIGQYDKANRKKKLMVVMDMIFETVAIATFTESIPEFRALTGGDFDIPTLKLALPEFAESNITEDTQMVVDFEEVKEEPIEADKPVENEEDLIAILRKKLSKNIAANVAEVVEMFNQKTGKELPPADAYIEIKHMLSNIPLIQRWDNAIAIIYRTKGEIETYMMLRKWLPTWGETEIGRLAEDAVRTAMAHSTEIEHAEEYRKILELILSREELAILKEDPHNIRVFLEIMEAEDKRNLVAPKEFRKFTDPEIRNGIGRIYSVMVPSKRNLYEQKNGRKSYVEKGYPA